MFVSIFFCIGAENLRSGYALIAVAKNIVTKAEICKVYA